MIATTPLPNSAEHPRILIVDDSAESLNILLRALEDDYTVTGARNGEKALRLAVGTPPPDLILLDIMMPGMNGYQVCARLKENEATRAIPVIFLTALEEEESETIGLNLGAVDYIRKPIRVATLHLRVKLQLELLQARRRLEEQNLRLVEAARLREDIDVIARHDLKGPLSMIIGVPEFLLMQCDFTKDQRTLVENVEKAGYQMLEMINRSLDLFKMEYDMYEFRPEPVDVLAVIHQALTELTPMVSAKKLRVVFSVEGAEETDGRAIMAMGEKFLCHSMFSNLCKNAIEASPSDSVVKISLSESNVIAVDIENSGEVPTCIRNRFFEKLVTSGKSSGTGLGTYSAQLIARTQKGVVSLDTSVGGRTTVRVTLPSAEAGRNELSAS